MDVKQHLPKLMPVLGLLALILAVYVPLTQNKAPLPVNPGYLGDGSALSVDLGPQPEPLLSKNPLDPEQIAQPQGANAFAVRKVKVHAPYQPIGLKIPDLEHEPINYFVMPFLPPAPQPPELMPDAGKLQVPPGSEWATLTLHSGATYRGDVVNNTTDTITFRIRETDGNRNAQPMVETFPQSEVQVLTPAVNVASEFQKEVAAARNNPLDLGEVCREALNRFPNVLTDPVMQLLQQGGMGNGPDSAKGLLAVIVDPALWSTLPPDKVAFYADLAEKSLAKQTDLLSLEILGFLRMQVNQFEGARKALEQANTLAPNNPSVLRMLAYAQLKTLQLAEAKATYETLIKNDLTNTDPIARIGLGMAQARMGDFTDAAATVQAAPVTTEDFLNRSYKGLAAAEILIAQDKVDDASTELGNDVKDDLTASRREMLYGIIAMKKDDTADAIKHFAAATDSKLPYIEPFAWFLYGIVTEATNPDDAHQRIAAAEKLSPFDPLIKMKLGDMAVKAKDMATAEKCYHQAVMLNPTDHRAWKRWIQSLPDDKKIGTVNDWIQLLKANNDPPEIQLQAEGVRSIFELAQDQADTAKNTAEEVTAKQPDNVSALITLAVLADRAKDENGIKHALETILARTQSTSLASWAQVGLNAVYAQAGEHLDYFNLRTEDEDHIRWGRTFGSRSGILRDYSADGLTVSGSPSDAHFEFIKFGFKVPGKDFIRARLTVTIFNGVKAAGIYAGRDSTTIASFQPPTMQVGVADGFLKTLLYRNKDSNWQAIDDPTVTALRGAQASFDGITLTYGLELSDPAKGIFKVSINGIDAGSTALTPLDTEYHMLQLQMAAGGFVVASKGIPFKIRFENLMVVSRAEDSDTTAPAPDAGLVHAGAGGKSN